MKTYPVYFWPRGTLASILRSDTIFGAVCWGIQILELEKDVGGMLAKFEPPRFAFSSLFPVYGRSEKRLRFYPRPIWFNPSLDEVEQLVEAAQKEKSRLSRKRALVTVAQKAKRLSELTYLSEELFGQVITGELELAQFYKNLLEQKKPGHNDEQIEQIETAALTCGERKAVHSAGPFKRWFAPTGTVQHNHVDRVAGATVEGLLFYENETYFQPQAGLWCALRTTADTLEELVKPALRYLADTGLGANRTTGKGHFDIEVGNAFTLPAADKEANGLVVLSRYLPKKGEWSTNDRPLAYQLETVTARREKKFTGAAPGQKQAPIYKRQIRMFSPGSVVPYRDHIDDKPSNKIFGRLAEVVPDDGYGRTIWQSGLAIGLPAKVPEL